MDCPLDQCVTEAANEPTSESLRSLNHLMKSHGVELNLFQDVSSEKLLLLQDRTSHVLKRTTEPTTSLLCLATLARLAKLPNGTMLMTGDEAAPSVDIYATARSFFTGKRAVKTLGLVILNAILSCKEDSPSATDEPLESRPLIKENLSLIKDIIDAVDHAQKNEWAQSHGATIRKLYDKLSGHTLSLPNRLKGAEIVLSLPGAELPSSLTTILEDQLRHEFNLQGPVHPIVSLLSVEVKDALVSKQLGGLLEALTLLTDVKQICQPESYLQDLIKAVKELQLERDGLEETTVEMEKAADAKNIEHVAKIASRDQLLDDLQKETVKAKEAREKEHMAEIAELNAKSHQGILEWKVKLEQAAQKVNEHAADITAKDQLIDDLQKATTDMEKTVEEKETTHLAEINQLKSTLSDLEASKANLEKTTAEEETAHLSEITQLQSNMQEMEETITQLRRAAETSELDHNVEITCRDQLIDDLRKFRVAYAKRVTSAVESALHCAQGGMQGIEAEDVD